MVINLEVTQKKKSPQEHAHVLCGVEIIMFFRCWSNHKKS